MGGSQGRTEATGYGVVFTIREALKELAIQGMGVAWLPRSTIERNLGDGSLCRVGGVDWGGVFSAAAGGICTGGIAAGSFRAAGFDAAGGTSDVARLNVHLVWSAVCGLAVGLAVLLRTKAARLTALGL